MLTVTVTTTATGHSVVLNLPQSHVAAAATTEDAGPSPIAPEVKELAWGAGSFIVLFVLMRLVLFPRLKKGMDARYGKIRGDHETADATAPQPRPRSPRTKRSWPRSRPRLASESTPLESRWRASAPLRWPTPMPVSPLAVPRRWLQSRLPGRRPPSRSKWRSPTSAVVSPSWPPVAAQIPPP